MASPCYVFIATLQIKYRTGRGCSTDDVPLSLDSIIVGLCMLYTCKGEQNYCIRKVTIFMKSLAYYSKLHVHHTYFSQSIKILNSDASALLFVLKLIKAFHDFGIFTRIVISLSYPSQNKYCCVTLFMHVCYKY